MKKATEERVVINVVNNGGTCITNCALPDKSGGSDGNMEQKLLFALLVVIIVVAFCPEEWQEILEATCEMVANAA